MCAYGFHSSFLFSVHMSLESNQSSLFTCKTRPEEMRTGEPLGGKVSQPEETLGFVTVVCDAVSFLRHQRGFEDGKAGGEIPLQVSLDAATAR